MKVECTHGLWFFQQRQGSFRGFLIPPLRFWLNQNKNSTSLLLNPWITILSKQWYIKQTGNSRVAYSELNFFLNRKCRKQIEIANEMLAYVIPGFRRSVLKHSRNITYGSIKQTLWLLIGFQNDPFGLLMCCIFTSSPLLKLLYAALLL